jgi:sec-independent protein translocase protein TatB
MTFAFIFESVGGTEWLLLLGVVLIVVGPKNLPAAARKMGQIMSTLRRAADEFKRQVMAMDQEVTKTVSDATSDTSSAASGESSGSDGATSENGEDLYGDDNPYPGYEEYYDDTQYQDGADGNEVADATDGDTKEETAETPPQKAPPTDEELRAIKITVTTTAADHSQKGTSA